MTTLFWQELILIALAVLLGMLLGCYLRRYWATRSQDKGTVIAAGASSAAASAFPADAAIDNKAGQAAKAEADALRLVEETNARLAEDDAQDDEASSSEKDKESEATTEAPDEKTEQSTETDDEESPQAAAGDESDPQSGASGSELETKSADAPSEAVAQEADSESVAASEEEVSEQSLENMPVAEEASEAEAHEEVDLNADGVVDSEEERIAAAIAALPDDATDEDKANVAGSRPSQLEAPRDGKADDLKRIKGVGKVIEGKLNNLGIYHFDQVANWSRDEVNWVTTFLSFKGRIDREEWIPQARGLMEEADASSEAAEAGAPKDETPADGTLSEETARIEEADLNADGDIDAEEARIAAAIAELPKDASMEDKANVAGSKPTLLEAPRDGKADDLKRIKGVGKVIEGKLNNLGIYHFDQVANWSRKEVNWVTTFLSFKGRVDRENWIEQARALAAGEETEFSKRVDKGEVQSSRG